MPKPATLSPDKAARIAAEIAQIEATRQEIRQEQIPDDGLTPYRFRWMWEVWLSDMPLTPKAVANAIWMYTRSGKINCFPPQTLLEAMTGLTNRPLRTAVYALRDAGFLHVVPGHRGRASDYRLTLPPCLRDRADRWLPEATNPYASEFGGCSQPPKSVKPFSSLEPKKPYTEKSSSAVPQKVLKTPAAKMIAIDGDDSPSENWYRQRFAELRERVKCIDHNNLMCPFMWNDKGFMAFMERARNLGADEFANLVCSAVVRENVRCSKLPMSIRTWAYFCEEMDFDGYQRKGAAMAG